METERRLALKILAAAAGLALAPALAWAQAPSALPDAVAEVPMLDPWVPPELREKAAAQPAPKRARGAQLQQQVERKLRARFDAAAGGTGVLTRDQARAAGLGAIDRDFDAIDRRGSGFITFDDYLRHLQR